MVAPFPSTAHPLRTRRRDPSRFPEPGCNTDVLERPDALSGVFLGALSGNVSANGDVYQSMNDESEEVLRLTRRLHVHLALSARCFARLHHLCSITERRTMIHWKERKASILIAAASAVLAISLLGACKSTSVSGSAGGAVGGSSVGGSSGTGFGGASEVSTTGAGPTSTGSGSGAGAPASGYWEISYGQGALAQGTFQDCNPFDVSGQTSPLTICFSGTSLAITGLVPGCDASGPFSPQTGAFSAQCQ